LTFSLITEKGIVSEDGKIIGIRHKKCNNKAGWFHTKSIITPVGGIMKHNWLRY